MTRLGIGADTMSRMIVIATRDLAQQHADVVRLRGLPRRLHPQAGFGAANPNPTGGSSSGSGPGGGGVGNWTREHPVLRRGPDGRIDSTSLGAAKVLETLDRGLVRVVDGSRKPRT